MPFTASTQSRDAQVRLQAEIDHFSTWGVGYQAKPGWLPTFNEPVVDTFSGAATFHLPIEVPPGRGGVQPTLSLSYNSRQLDGLLAWAQSGWVGHGWELDTVSIGRDLGPLQFFPTLPAYRLH